jgi:kynurenine formamidase
MSLQVWKAWHGWPEVPAISGEWVELSHPLRADLPRIAYFPEARFRRLKSMPTDPLNLTEMQMVCHYGTHVDAPCHFIPDGPAFQDIPLAHLCGPGVVWRIDAAPDDEIEAVVLARQEPRARPGDIVLLDTGWAAHFGTDRYERHPALAVSAARWLVEQRVKLVGFDLMTPDLAVVRRPPGFGWPVHHELLAHGVLIAENLTSLRPLAGRRVEAMFLALNIVGADGAPVRAIARLAD